MILNEVAILVAALGIASVINYFIIGAIAKAIVESKESQDEPKPFPYTTLVFANALSWLVLSSAFITLGFMMWKSIYAIEYYKYGMLLGVSTISFILMGALVAEQPSSLPPKMNTSIKMSFIFPNHKKETGDAQEVEPVSNEVNTFRLINLIIFAVSICSALIMYIK
jgi:hypothetical protein